MSSVEKLKIISEKFNVRELSSIVLDDPKFPLWSGSAKEGSHHYGKGGLAQHVLEVVELCLSTNDYFTTIGSGVDPKKLFLAALFHDIGKVYDYEPLNENMTEWGPTKHKNLVHHITRAALIWGNACKNFEDKDDEILHAILSHHGQKEWGSPVTPQTTMAWILHNCDNMSARVNDCLKSTVKKH